MVFFWLTVFAAYPLGIIALAMDAREVMWMLIPWALLLALRLDGLLKNRLVRQLKAVRLADQDPRLSSVYRMFIQYAPDRFRSRVQVQVYVFPKASLELKIWMDSPQKVSLLVSEGFFEKAPESQWRHFFQSWTPAWASQVQSAQRREGLAALFLGWKGQVNTARHWWLSFWLLPVERVLKISPR